MGTLDGRIAIITGAGRGLGREHALLFAAEGAKVVVNDLGGGIDGAGRDVTPAQQVADEIKAGGGEAVANTDDVADWEGARRLVEQAIETFGDLHVLVNNAGILRDRTLVNMAEQEWDDVVFAVHGGIVGLYQGWTIAERAENDQRWEIAELRAAMKDFPPGPPAFEVI